MNLFEHILHKADNPTKEDNERVKKLLEKNSKKK